MKKIEIKNLSFSYTENHKVLKNIDLKFDQTPTAIIGQNGAGKTTLVKLLKGLLKPVEGEVWVNGKSTSKYSVSDLASEIGFVFQNPNDQIFKHNVLSEVEFGPLNIDFSEKEAKKRALDALKMVELEHLVDKNPYDLTLSERKLVTIASIIAMDPSIILFDEPTIAQDHKGKELIKEVIHTLKNQGKLVVAILHDMDFVGEVFDRTIIMSEGKLLFDGETREAFSHEEVVKQAGLDLPYVTQLCKKLGSQETFLTVEEYVENARNG